MVLGVEWKNLDGKKLKKQMEEWHEQGRRRNYEQELFTKPRQVWVSTPCYPVRTSHEAFNPVCIHIGSHHDYDPMSQEIYLKWEEAEELYKYLDAVIKAHNQPEAGR